MQGMYGDRNEKVLLDEVVKSHIKTVFWSSFFNWEVKTICYAMMSCYSAIGGKYYYRNVLLSSRVRTKDECIYALRM